MTLGTVVMDVTGQLMLENLDSTVKLARISLFARNATKGIRHICINLAEKRYPLNRNLPRIIKSLSQKLTCYVTHVASAFWKQAREFMYASLVPLTSKLETSSISALSVRKKTNILTTN